MSRPTSHPTAVFRCLKRQQTWGACGSTTGRHGGHRDYVTFQPFLRNPGLDGPAGVEEADQRAAAAEPVCVVDIERHLPLAQSTVSHHLKALLDAGVIGRERRGRWSFHSLRPGRLAGLRDSLNGHLQRLATSSGV
ncbi:MAG: ArsR/SmtB family transcription factor [Acidimicrobiia bacterium]